MKRIALRVAGGPPVAENPPGGPFAWPVLAKGFRPFFLLAALYVAVVLPLWLLWQLGLADPGGSLRGMDWHAHEMIFGFAMAVVAGFLLTAAGNWTGRETATGGTLLALALLWAAGRATILLPETARLLTALCALAFLPALAFIVGRALARTQNRRNYAFLGLLTLLWSAELLVQLDVLGVLPGWRRRGHLLAVDLLVLMILLMGGRIIPSFTRNATGQSAIRNVAWLDRATLGAMLAVAVTAVVVPDHPVAAALSLTAGLLSALRTVPWGARHSLAQPLLWVLHVAYLWIPMGLLLRGLAGVGWAAVPQSLATHALTAGAIGTMTLGMMARVALGHTGRPLAAARLTTAAFVAVTAAAVVRVLLPLALPTAYRSTLFLSGTLFAMAFALFLVTYAPILVRPRLDARPG